MTQKYAVNVTIPADSEPISVEEAKLHLRVDDDSDDSLIESLIITARDWIEQICNAALLTQTIVLQLDEWPVDDEFEMPRYPLRTVTSISYVDEDGTSHSMDTSNLIIDTRSKPGRLILKADADWPSETLQRKAGITVTYTAGFGSAADVPAIVVHAMKLLIGHWYENRELTVVGSGVNVTQLPFSVQNLLSNLKY